MTKFRIFVFAEALQLVITLVVAGSTTQIYSTLTNEPTTNQGTWSSYGGTNSYETIEASSGTAPYEVVSLSTSEQIATGKQNTSYCSEDYECDDPFTMNSKKSFSNDGVCTCPSTYLNTGECCLTQWWFIGLATGAGVILLVLFLIAIGCCCHYKSQAEKALASKATSNNVMVQPINNGVNIEDGSTSPQPESVAMVTFATETPGPANYEPVQGTEVKGSGNSLPPSAFYSAPAPAAGNHTQKNDQVIQSQTQTNITPNPSSHPAQSNSNTQQKSYTQDPYDANHSYHDANRYQGYEQNGEDEDSVDNYDDTTLPSNPGMGNNGKNSSSEASYYADIDSNLQNIDSSFSYIIKRASIQI